MAGLMIATSAWLAAPACLADSSTVRLPVSGRPDIAKAQSALIDAWSAIDDLYVDSSTLKRVDWQQQLIRALWRAQAAESAEAALNELHVMLLHLDDPYTRVAPSSLFSEYKNTADGQLSGVGLLLASEHSSRQLVVVAPMNGGPAQRAGIRRGDVLTAIDGTTTQDMAVSSAGELLRGRTGSSVKVQVVRPADEQPGVAARPAAAQYQTAPASPHTQSAVLDLTLRREAVPLASAQSAKLSMGGLPIGYIRLDTFTHTSGAEVQRAVHHLSAQGVRGFVLDLRDNPGGLVEAGLDVAHTWLPGDSVVFNISGRDNELRHSIMLDPGPALTTLPLTVLVNGQSASASEILAGALHDNGRAQLVGDSDTFGKGKIQTVYQLQDGSALFVTVARYQTPAREDIDQKGIRPDTFCRAAPSQDLEEDLSDDAVPASALPVELRSTYGAQVVPERLFSDPCFMAASKVLSAAVRHPSALPQVPHVSKGSASVRVS